MASAWERKRHCSHQEKAAAFLPRLLAEDSPKSEIQTVHGVLLFADISGGVTRAILGHTRLFGALPPRQSGHLVTAEVFCWDAPRERDGLSWAVNHCCHQH